MREPKRKKCQVEPKLKSARWTICQVGQVAFATWRFKFIDLATWPIWARWNSNGQSCTVGPFNLKCLEKFEDQIRYVATYDEPVRKLGLVPNKASHQPSVISIDIPDSPTFQKIPFRLMPTGRMEGRETQCTAIINSSISRICIPE